MSLKTSIPIRNIYYMLCYYWGVKPFDEDSQVGDEDFIDIYNLMSRVLNESLQPVIKRGFYRKYREDVDNTLMPRGKILMSESMCERSNNSRKLTCEYDDLSSNVKFNQIIKFTLSYLIRYEGLNKELKQDLVNTRRYFDNVDSKEITLRDYRSITFDRNNKYYSLTLNICRLIQQHMIANSGEGNRFPQLSDEEILSVIYEKFIFNYCKTKFVQCNVKREKIRWDLIPGSNDLLMPKMNTDVTIENPDSKIRLIIDAKFYTSMMDGRYEGCETFISTNLYQIYSYMNNHPEDRFENHGMLIYPQTRSAPMSKSYTFRDSKRLHIISINLDEDWESIRETLDGLLRYASRVVM